mgnify:CR=1 FL=1
MVDEIELARRSQAALAATATWAQPVQSVETQPSLDAVDLSSSARDIVAELSQSTTIAEAWLKQKIKTPDLTDPDSLRSRPNLFAVNVDTASSDEQDKPGQRSLARSFNTAMGDISWLIDALGIGKFDVSKVASAVAQRAATDGVGVRPPVSVLIAQAEKSRSTAALYLEGLSVTVQKGKTVDASVERVAITTINPSMSASFTGTGRPMVLDVGGQLQEIAAPVMGDDGGSTATDVASQAAKVAEILLATSMKRSDQPNHALVVVREGGKLHPEGTLKLKMDVLQPIS